MFKKIFQLIAYARSLMVKNRKAIESYQVSMKLQEDKAVEEHRISVKLLEYIDKGYQEQYQVQNDLISMIEFHKKLSETRKIKYKINRTWYTGSIYFIWQLLFFCFNYSTYTC